MMPENKKSRKPRKIKAFGVVCGVPARIRTGGVPLRRRTLYPTEVQRHLAICGYFYSTHLPPFCERREVEQTLRRRTLYPAELRAHIMKFGYFYSTHLPPFGQRREVEQAPWRRSLYPTERYRHMGAFPHKQPEKPALLIIVRQSGRRQSSGRKD